MSNDNKPTAWDDLHMIAACHGITLPEWIPTEPEKATAREIVQKVSDAAIELAFERHSLTTTEYEDGSQVRVLLGSSHSGSKFHKPHPQIDLKREFRGLIYV